MQQEMGKHNLCHVSIPCSCIFDSKLMQCALEILEPAARKLCPGDEGAGSSRIS